VIINLVIRGKPLTKSNSKAFSMRNKRAYKPKKYKTFEKDVALQVKREMKKVGLTAPVTSEMGLWKFYLYFKTKRKRDLFNYGKSYFDAMNGVLYEDDSQIYLRDCSSKIFVDKHCEPRAEIVFIWRDEE